MRSGQFNIRCRNLKKKKLHKIVKSHKKFQNIISLSQNRCRQQLQQNFQAVKNNNNNKILYCIDEKKSKDKNAFSMFFKSFNFTIF